jgi:hypothetical protein
MINNKHSMKKYVAYHENFPGVPCADGFTSAWVAKKRYPEAILKGARYGDILSSPLHYCEFGDQLFVVDFSFTFDDIHSLNMLGVKVQVFDHHEGAQDELNRYQRWVEDFIAENGEDGEVDLEMGDGQEFIFDSSFFQYHFDNDESGCTLTWRKLFPDKPLPAFLKYIGANDTRNPFYFENYDRVKCVTGAIWDLKHNFGVYDALEQMTETQITEMLENPGKENWEKRKERITEISKNIIFDDFFGIQNIPQLKLNSKDYALRSDVCEIFLMANPNTPFMAVSLDIANRTQYSLRSFKYGGNYDVKSLCLENGGGGHYNAAGFEVTRS